jgi:hypothetical protein
MMDWDRRVMSAALLGLAILALISAPALGASGGIIQVAQPLIMGDGTIVVSTVSYHRSYIPTVRIPGYEVSLVGEANCVCVDEPPGASRNLNAANLLGIKMDIDPFHKATSRLIGDTLHVTMDLSSLNLSPEESRYPFHGRSVDAVIKATVECILLTASWNRTGIDDPENPGLPGACEAKYIWVDVKGPKKYAIFGGVFSFAGLGTLPRERIF